MLISLINNSPVTNIYFIVCGIVKTIISRIDIVINNAFVN